MKSWIKILNPEVQGQKHIICIPYAGGYSASYQPLNAHLKTGWKLVTLDPPGHGGNKMRLFDDIEELVELYIKELDSYFDSPFILLGHSMGGRIVHRMAQALQKKERCPLAVVISATAPPFTESSHLATDSDDAILDYLLSRGAIPSQFKAHQELLDMYLPIFKADFIAMETHNYPDTSLLACPLYIIGGEQDHQCSPSLLRGWEKWAEQTTFFNIDGEHMYIIDQPKLFTKAMEAIISGLSSRNEIC